MKNAQRWSSRSVVIIFLHGMLSCSLIRSDRCCMPNINQSDLTVIDHFSHVTIDWSDTITSPVPVLPAAIRVWVTHCRQRLESV